MQPNQVNVNSVGQSVFMSLNNGIAAVVNFVPKFIAGLIILLIGIIIASLVKRVVIEIFRVLKIEVFLKKYGLPGGKADLSWASILAEIVRWFVIVLFLIPT